MNGYELLLVLYSETETWRKIRIPGDINFKQLHDVIQKIFAFDNYHMWQFKIPTEVPEQDAVDLNDIVRVISSDDAGICIKDTFDEYDVLVYEYDFGDSWEIIITKISEMEYDNKTALITDYKGKYNPMDDMGGFMIFDEIMRSIDDDEELEYILNDYNLSRSDLSKMDFEKKYKKGSRIRIN
ncbi:MAG: hypothetical protein Q4Q22_07525 [Methanosphaera sp.]|nr:hypothetical protein [Methanosphaera sp.]